MSIQSITTAIASGLTFILVLTLGLGFAAILGVAGLLGLVSRYLSQALAKRRRSKVVRCADGTHLIDGEVVR